MLVGLLRLTSNLLMLSLGIDNFTLVMKDFWLKFPPEPFASDEALAFSGYMADLKLPVPHLAKILEYEIAAVGSLSSGTSHVVKFEFDPIPLLRALSDGRLPDVLGAPGKYEIELDGRRQFGGTGGSLDAVGVAVGGLERSLNHRASSELWAQ